MASKRRLGPRNSEISQAILDATEVVMREEGYGAVSSRRIAQVAGVQQGLVYYYFETMDELLLATFQRRVARRLDRYKEYARAEHTISSIWQDFNRNLDGRMSFEFVALANHHEGIRAELVRFLTESRRLQASVIAKEAPDTGVELNSISPTALAFLIHCANLVMSREAAIGVTEGHDEVRALFTELIEKLG